MVDAVPVNSVELGAVLPDQGAPMAIPHVADVGGVPARAEAVPVPVSAPIRIEAPKAGSPRNLHAQRPASPSAAQRGLVNNADRVPEGSPQLQGMVSVVDSDRRVRRSSFARQRTQARGPPKTENAYYWNAFMAWLMTGVHLTETITEWMLMYDYYNRGHPASGSALVAIHVLNALTATLFDYTNNGRCKYMLLDILQLRVLVELNHYLKDWRKHQYKPWANKDFRSSVRFETFLGSAASLIVQVHAIISQDDVDNLSWVQITCIVFTCFQAMADLLHFFKYVSLTGETYFIMMCKAVYNICTRTALVAYLASRLKGYVYLWALLSLGIGFVIYFASVCITRSKKRDDPLEFPKVHAIFGTLVATHMCFVSFPFAPTHSISDWWVGYLVTELKIILENICMVGAVAALWEGTHDVLFYAALFFAGSAFLVNVTLLIYLHRSVTKQLKKRGLYSSSLIVKLWAYVCGYMKDNIRAAKARKEGLDHERASTLDEDRDLDDEDYRKAQEKKHGPA